MLGLALASRGLGSPGFCGLFHSILLASVVGAAVSLSANAQSGRGEEDAGAAGGGPQESTSPAGEERVWTESDSGDGVWKEEEFQEKKDEKEFFEEEEEAGEVFATALRPGEHEVVVEFRNTDVFDQPLDPVPIFGPPPDRLYYGSYGAMPNHTNYFKLEMQQLAYDEQDGAGGGEQEGEDDSGWAMVSWQRTLATGARLYLDYGYPWTETAGSGFWLSAEYGWRAGLNLDLAARVQCVYGSSPELDSGGEAQAGARAWGWRLQGRAEAALTGKTALAAGGWYYWDEAGVKASRQELELAQYVARRTGLHAQVRRNVVSLREVPWPEFPDTRAVVTTLEVRHRLRDRNTLLRGGLRWYSDSEDVSATGVSVGADQPFRRGSFGAHYRRYVTTEDVAAGTWWLVLKLRF